MNGIGFDSEKYLAEQSAAILERAGKFGDKLYLEFGGKLICDYHAARVLPGFDPDAKIKLLQRLKDKVDIIICIYAGAIEEAAGINHTTGHHWSQRRKRHPLSK